MLSSAGIRITYLTGWGGGGGVVFLRGYVGVLFLFVCTLVSFCWCSCSCKIIVVIIFELFICNTFIIRSNDMGLSF